MSCLRRSVGVLGVLERQRGAHPRHVQGARRGRRCARSAAAARRAARPRPGGRSASCSTPSASASTSWPVHGSSTSGSRQALVGDEVAGAPATTPHGHARAAAELREQRSRSGWDGRGRARARGRSAAPPGRRAGGRARSRRLAEGAQLVLGGRLELDRRSRHEQRVIGALDPVGVQLAQLPGQRRGELRRRRADDRGVQPERQRCCPSAPLCLCRCCSLARPPG